MIGADGATSRVRKSLFPGLNVRYSAPLRECYQGKLDVEKTYIHWFFPISRYRPRFDLVHKGDVFLIEGCGIRVLRNEIEELLAPYGFVPRNRPIWRDGCAEPLLHDDLVRDRFRPAKGNILLVGDAAGLIFPITFEGIGAALKTGLLAAEAVQEATGGHAKAEERYFHKIDPVLKEIKRLYQLQEEIEQMPVNEPEELSSALVSAYLKTLQVH